MESATEMRASFLNYPAHQRDNIRLWASEVQALAPQPEGECERCAGLTPRIADLLERAANIAEKAVAQPVTVQDGGECEGCKECGSGQVCDACDLNPAPPSAPERPSTITSEDVKEGLAQGVKGAEYMRSERGLAPPSAPETPLDEALRDALSEVIQLREAARVESNVSSVFRKVHAEREARLSADLQAEIAKGEKFRASLERGDLCSLEYGPTDTVLRYNPDLLTAVPYGGPLPVHGTPVQDGGDCEKCAGLRASVDDSMRTVRCAQDELARAAQHVSTLRGEFDVERQRHKNIEGNLFYETRLLREQIVGYGGDPKINVAIGTTSDPVEHLTEQLDRALLLIEKLTVSNDEFKKMARLALESLKQEQDGSLKQLDWSKK